MKGAADLSGGSEIKLDDKSSVKVSKRDAIKVVKNLEKLKPLDRGKVQKAMQKNKSEFNKFFNILKK